ncbi:DNA-directed RNA polymerase specialized sigma24 family protein [Enterococcus sp. PF1-24]|uniref:RNA polymerase sigma factor n=1 Tax=unclassified Enterococcus TaxID=2608891 RepID=UPI00247633EE|nr:MULTISPECIES: sigma-70 family RNA polymerase sigma factor [unclassified Enterococcus]MDH6365650.1 DNA-directed RNA polymerase specialized sigma24 family protein [Enterococcus sp. PFB1-1]MDH6402751.1 DNA-directed RNA polymerase specialized sigma24 family protein [Enterococcus sp. PF1-24]
MSAAEVDEKICSPAAPLSKEEHLDIYEGIRRLPQHLQEVTILHYFYGKKVKEISAVFNEPVGTTKYKLHEARRKLKIYLEEDKA